MRMRCVLLKRLYIVEVPAGTPADKAGLKGTYRCARVALLSRLFKC